MYTKCLTNLDTLTEGMHSKKLTQIYRLKLWIQKKFNSDTSIEGNI